MVVMTVDVVLVSSARGAFVRELRDSAAVHSVLCSWPVDRLGELDGASMFGVTEGRVPVSV
jgi:hypothetical protein